jgi:hypothetical protein
MVLWLVLTLATLLGLMFFSFHLSVRQRNAQAHAAYFGQVAVSLAQSGVNLAFRELRRQFADQGSPIRREIDQASAATLDGLLLPLNLQGHLLQLTEGLGNNLDVEVQAEILECQGTGSSDEGADPLEQDCLIEVTSLGSFRTMERKIVERRSLRVQLDLLPVLNRFTLFVKNPSLERGGNPGYNRFANDINGSIDLETVSPRDNFLPLVLFNHGETFPSLHHEIEENGWVFLGGREKIRLNLASGADYQYGQYFHFYNFLASDTSKQAAFLSDDPPGFFRQTYPVLGKTHRYFLKHVIYGFFTVDRGTPPSNMNRDDILKLSFQRNPNARSSTLHLYGSTLAPSPTRVFGPVYHSFPIYTGVTVDSDGDGRRDGVVRLVPEVDESGYQNLSTTHPLPTSVRNIARASYEIALDPGVTDWTRLFPDYPTYEQYMSTIVRNEPYNTGIDYLFNQGQFPPSTTFLDANEDYPNSGETVVIQRRGTSSSEGLHFEGDLNDFQSETLRDRALLEVADQAEFNQAFLRSGGVLVLGIPVRVREGNLSLPADLYVERGGLLLVEGDISFDGIRCKNGERLSLVSLTGNITSPFDRASLERPVEADLVALSGAVRSTNSNHPLSVRGTVAAGYLEPADLVAGGRILFDPSGDPAAPDRSALLRVHLSDRSEGWQL